MGARLQDISPGGDAMPPAVVRARDWRALWLIGRRGALESLRDRMTIIVSLLFAIGLPTVIVNTVVRLQVALSRPGDEVALGQALAIYFLMIGLAPTTGAMGIACGQFAGEKESGSLAPLLASPASNVAIFGGKILAAVLPTLVFAIVAEVAFLGNLAVVIGVAGIVLLPADLSVAMLALVPALAIFSATIASLVSSRVRTFNTAQQISGLVLAPSTAILAAVAFNLPRLGTLGLAVVVLAYFAIDLILILLSARTWRREEVLAGR